MKYSVFSRRLRVLLLAGALVLAAVAVVYILGVKGIGIPCLFYRITGFMCPGCGNSRAALALLRLDVTGALSYNMLFPLEFFYIGWVLIHCGAAYLKAGRFAYRPRKFWLDLLVLVCVLLWWVLRNLAL